MASKPVRAQSEQFVRPFRAANRRLLAGLVGDFRRAQDWKRFRVTPHDHDPVNDAMGNVEAFETIQRLRHEGRLR